MSDDPTLSLIEQFFVNIATKDYETALECTTKSNSYMPIVVLEIDPTNSLVLRYQPVLKERIQQLSEMTDDSSDISETSSESATSEDSS
jgi:hypothetical protein